VPVVGVGPVAREGKGGGPERGKAPSSLPADRSTPRGLSVPSPPDTPRLLLQVLAGVFGPVRPEPSGLAGHPPVGGAPRLSRATWCPSTLVGTAPHAFPSAGVVPGPVVTVRSVAGPEPPRRSASVPCSRPAVGAHRRRPEPTPLRPHGGASGRPVSLRADPQLDLVVGSQVLRCRVPSGCAVPFAVPPERVVSGWALRPCAGPSCLVNGNFAAGHDGVKGVRGNPQRRPPDPAEIPRMCPMTHRFAHRFTHR